MNGTCCCVELTVTEDAEVLLSVAEDSQIALDVQEQFVDGGGGITPTGTKTINVTENGTTTTDVTYYANAKVVANVPNTYATADEGKVVQDGRLEAQTTATFSANDVFDTTTIKQVTVDVPASAVDSGYVYVTENDTVNVVGYAQAVVNVPNTYTAADEGKVVDDGALVSQGSVEYTANGTYDTTLISSVEVSVSGGEPTGTKEISITSNGTTTENVASYAYAEITANVPNTYAAADEGKVVDDGALVAQTSVTKTTNGTYDTTLNNEVTINVPTGTARTSADLTASGDTVTVPAGLYASNATKAVAAGTAGTPTATKGTVSNHSVSVTPSVTNSAGYISSETKTGTAVTVSASELVSGSETKTANGTYDVTNLAELVVNVSGGGGGNYSEVISLINGTFTGALSNNDITVVPDGFCSGTRNQGITSVSLPNCTAVGANGFYQRQYLSSINLPLCATLGNTAFGYSGGSANPHITILVFPSLTKCGMQTFRNMSYLTTFDTLGGTASNAWDTNVFVACSSLNTFILRQTSGVSPIPNINFLASTPFASGGAGGTLYVPNALISAYQSATNWSTILGYANNSIQKIEGSYYETHYADGTVIS